VPQVETSGTGEAVHSAIELTNSIYLLTNGRSAQPLAHKAEGGRGGGRRLKVSARGMGGIGTGGRGREPGRGSLGRGTSLRCPVIAGPALTDIAKPEL